MKTLTQHINEWKINNNSISNVEYEYNYFPKNFWELRSIIKDIYEDDPLILDLRDIDISNVESFIELSSQTGKLETLFSELELVKTIDISTWKINKNVTSCDLLFYKCEQLSKIIGLNTLDLKNVESFFATFQYCKKIKTFDISKLKLGKIISLKQMFYSSGIKEFYGFDKIDLSNLKTTENMFAYCKNLKIVDGLDNIAVSNKIKNISHGDMFKNCDKSILPPSWY